MDGVHRKGLSDRKGVMKIVFDLDGVIRDLAGHVARKYDCPYPETWDTTYQGKTLF